MGLKNESTVDSQTKSKTAKAVSLMARFSKWKRRPIASTAKARTTLRKDDIISFSPKRNLRKERMGDICDY
jgi:hypothetical protein